MFIRPSSVAQTPTFVRKLVKQTTRNIKCLLLLLTSTILQHCDWPWPWLKVTRSAKVWVDLHALFPNDVDGGRHCTSPIDSFPTISGKSQSWYMIGIFSTFWVHVNFIPNLQKRCTSFWGWYQGKTFRRWRFYKVGKKQKWANQSTWFMESNSAGLTWAEKCSNIKTPLYNEEHPVSEDDRCPRDQKKKKKKRKERKKNSLRWHVFGYLWTKCFFFKIGMAIVPTKVYLSTLSKWPWHSIKVTRAWETEDNSIKYLKSSTLIWWHFKYAMWTCWSDEREFRFIL